MIKKQNGFRAPKRKLRNFLTSTTGQMPFYLRTTPPLMGRYCRGILGLSQRVGWILFVWRVLLTEWIQVRLLQIWQRSTNWVKKERR